MTVGGEGQCTSCECVCDKTSLEDVLVCAFFAADRWLVFFELSCLNNRGIYLSSCTLPDCYRGVLSDRRSTKDFGNFAFLILLLCVNLCDCIRATQLCTTGTNLVFLQKVLKVEYGDDIEVMADVFETCQLVQAERFRVTRCLNVSLHC